MRHADANRVRMTIYVNREVFDWLQEQAAPAFVPAGVIATLKLVEAYRKAKAPCGRKKAEPADVECG